MRDIDRTRANGITSMQMLLAPQDAIYIWCNNSLGYPRDLAKYIGRRDLKIYGPSHLGDARLAGHHLTGIVVDHAAHLTEFQYENLRRAMLSVRTTS